MAVKRQAIKNFIAKWQGKGKEHQDDRSFWIDILQDIFELTKVTERLEFQKPVVGPDNNFKYIDVYIPETKVLIEQKSLNIPLDKPQAGHKGMTPYQQAKMYDNGLRTSEKARWIVTSNFAEIWIYNMDTSRPEDSVTKISLDNLDSEYNKLSFLYDPQVEQIRKETEISKEAGLEIGKIYDALLKQYPQNPSEDDLRNLNAFCVRIVFCYYAEDAGLFDNGLFSSYIASYNPKHLKTGLKELFRILNTKETDREQYEEESLLAFPYVNGNLFNGENDTIPQINEEIKAALLSAANFDWSDISPTIFGAIFESTLNQKTRAELGMHYTSIEDIHKIIDPLFLNDLKTELETIKASKQPNVRVQKLRAFQDKLASLKFLDPACGSGNFLTETYLSLRRLENDVIATINKDQIEVIAELSSNPIKVQLDQFYGIEINDFAVSVARTALWIAENQMMEKTKEIVLNADSLNFLPLKSFTDNIRKKNALLMDWKEVLEPSKCSYIFGNPPFIGKKEQSADQKKELINTYGSRIPGVGNMDYVTGWYVKAAEYMTDTNITAAFVSTNSITQGEQPYVLWTKLNQLNVHICFAYRTFVWNSGAKKKAHVHCVIIGFKVNNPPKERFIYDGLTKVKANYINAYLLDAETDPIKKRSKPFGDVLSISYGSMPIDNNNLILDEHAYKEALSENPNNIEFIREYVGGDELLNGKKRWCIWLDGVDPTKYFKSKFIMNRIEANKNYRKNESTRPQTIKAAETPHLFGEIRQPHNGALVIPKVSSEERDYIPISYVKPGIIINGSALMIPNADLYYFGILSSSVHNAWMRVVAGRYEMRYQYSAEIVYNNFPWPKVDSKQRENIVNASKAIIEAREKLDSVTLANMYKHNNFILFTELKKAHDVLDKLVMEAYGMSYQKNTELDCVSELMKMYQEHIDNND